MKKIALVSGAMVILGCQHLSLQAEPAVLSAVNADVKLQLQQRIIELIGGAPVKLSDTVLTRNNILIIEQAVLRDNAGLPIMGRHHQLSNRFSLWLDADGCWLQHDSSEKRVVLTGVSCTALQSKS
ncbi:hypothetical protein MN199_00160 [Rheinheimera metallidurans]